MYNQSEDDDVQEYFKKYMGVDYMLKIFNILNPKQKQLYNSSILPNAIKTRIIKNAMGSCKRKLINMGFD